MVRKLKTPIAPSAPMAEFSVLTRPQNRAGEATPTCRGIGLWFPLVDLFETHVDGIKNDGLRMEIGVIAQTHMEQLDDLRLLSHFEMMLAEDGEHREAIDSLDTIYRYGAMDSLINSSTQLLSQRTTKSSISFSRQNPSGPRILPGRRGD